MARAVIDAVPLERMSGDGDRPCLVDARSVEDATLRSHAVGRDRHSAFAAFLDGTQHSDYRLVIGRAPVVVGRVAAAIRERVDRKLRAWGTPLVEERVYAPLAHLSPRERAALLDAAPGVVVDTTVPDADGVIPAPHPLLLLERAKFAVSRDREAAERTLAERWCAAEQRPLFIDGGIGGSEVVGGAACAIGVIKSHRTLYVDDGGLDVLFALAKGERTSVVSIAPRGRAAVYSWYLRLRDAAGHDALWGTVRVEVAPCADPTRRANDVSQWILAEMAPNAMPDARWDKMAYGVRNTEEFLRAL
ncbi:MAG: hypothetical protein ABJD07_03240 [Gemmatimonadaceae bacterium]